ncbi:hypothetical protein AYI69_g4498 [Smittium culicis]|uniref:Retrovirus-related Pol polyprotein from transposon n=1 Tax=Smittium culicis TaxID=133412 RepID=A0A1R1YD58_9FUNG|nr:hypothetical protein AYI69_g4498 [Smittium culicis]
MGNNSKGSSTDLIAIATLSTGNVEFKTTFRILDEQPYDVILGANFIVLAKVNYNPSKMTIKFKNERKMDVFRMQTSDNGIEDWAPLILAAGAVDSSFDKDTEISDILLEVASLFDPAPSVIKTEYPHQLRLLTQQPVKAKMRRYSPEETRVLVEHVKELYKSGYARPSKSPYSVNPLIVPKADGTPRVEKIIFGVPKIQILGYSISEEGQEISPEKIEAVKNYPRPTNETSLRRFIVMVSFCRSFISSFTETAEPL